MSPDPQGIGECLDFLRETLLDERDRYKLALRRITNTGFATDCRTIARVALDPSLAGRIRDGEKPPEEK